MITQTQNVAAKNIILPTNFEDLNLGDINDTDTNLVCKPNTTESYKESSKDIPN